MGGERPAWAHGCHVGILREFEKRLEGLVEGFFARALPGGGVQPIELGKRMVRTMDEQRTVNPSGASYVPNAFEFRLSPADHDRLTQIESTLRRELAAVARRAAATEQWHLVGSPEIRIARDEALKRGTFTVRADWIEADQPEPKAGPQTQLIQMSMDADAELVQIGKTTRAWPLSKDAVVIGRLETCDVIVADPGASRRHAEIRREGDEWVVIDLGSTNGTEINGKRVNRHRLQPGDRILLGETTLEFRRP